MVIYSKVDCKLTNVQLNKLKKAVKSNEGATLRLSNRNFNKDETPHELLLTTRQNTKLRNALINIYRNELDKACFQHDSAYADHKDLINRTEADKVLRDKAYDIASNPKYDGYQRGLASMVYKFFDKKSTAEPSALARSSLERTGGFFNS